MGKGRRCRNKECGKLFTPIYTTIQPVCSPRCALLYTRDLEEKRKRKSWKEEKKIIKEELKTLSEHRQDARKWFQLWIRKVRDKNRPCVSCGVTSAAQFDAGHYFSAHQFSGLVFDEQNVHKQCSTCNNHHHGALVLYRLGLISRYGELYVEQLEAKRDMARNYKYTREELIKIKEEYKNRLKNGK